MYMIAPNLLAASEWDTYREVCVSLKEDIQSFTLDMIDDIFVHLHLHFDLDTAQTRFLAIFDMFCHALSNVVSFLDEYYVSCSSSIISKLCHQFISIYDPSLESRVSVNRLVLCKYFVLH